MARRDGHRRRSAPSAVLDTNIYVSAFLFGGAPAQVVALARGNRVDVLMSSSLWHELRHVLRDKFGWSEDRVGEVWDDLKEFVTWVEPTERITVFKGKDEPDNRVLEAALAGRASGIVSGDRHLLDLKRFRGIPISTPRAFLERLEGRRAA